MAQLEIGTECLSCGAPGAARTLGTSSAGLKAERVQAPTLRVTGAVAPVLLLVFAQAALSRVISQELQFVCVREAGVRSARLSKTLKLSLISG